MSEQNIWNNTYVLGDVSGTTISAGPGIKIDDSTPGVIKVSTDETVLWTSTGGMVSTFTLSEKLSNFEKFRMIFQGYNTPQSGMIEDYSPADGSNISYCYEHYVANTDGNPLQIWAGRFSTNDSLTYNIIDWKWMCMAGDNNTWSNTWNNNDRKPYIKEIRGINRKEGN